MAGAFTDALDQLDQIFAAGTFEQRASRSVFYTLAKSYAPSTSAEDIRRMVTHCLRALGLGEHTAPTDVSPEALRSLEWAADHCMEALLIDGEGRNRSYVASAVRRKRALGPDMSEGAPDTPRPLPHVPLEMADAAALIAPYLAGFEAALDTNPLAHIHLSWQVFEHPAPPFDTVFRNWLGALDAKRGTADLEAIERAIALADLAQESRQRLSWKNCEARVLPQLGDPHPLVATAAARFLGDIYAELDERIFGGSAISLPLMLDRIAALPQHRRIVAGGFLHGFGTDMDPFGELRKDPALDGYDIDEWALKIFAQKTPEPFLPAAQSFWFHVHEAYCFDAAFVARLIDAGHLWEALMTATEMHEAVEGMKPVLTRLAAVDVPDIAVAAQAWLDRHYTAQ